MKVYERILWVMNELKKIKQHNVMLYNRQQMTLSGVIRVDNFNDNVIVLITEAGQLTLEGENLHISKLFLDSGDMEIDGNISALFYTDEADSDSRKPKRFLSKIFK